MTKILEQFRDTTALTSGYEEYLANIRQKCMEGCLIRSVILLNPKNNTMEIFSGTYDEYERMFILELIRKGMMQ